MVKLGFLFGVVLLFPTVLLCMVVPYSNDTQTTSDQFIINFKPLEMLSICTASSCIATLLALQKNISKGNSLFFSQGFTKDKRLDLLSLGTGFLMFLSCCGINECAVDDKMKVILQVLPMLLGAYVPFVLATIYCYYTRPRPLKKR